MIPIGDRYGSEKVHALDNGRNGKEARTGTEETLTRFDPRDGKNDIERVFLERLAQAIDVRIDIPFSPFVNDSSSCSSNADVFEGGIHGGTSHRRRIRLLPWIDFEEQEMYLQRK